MTVRKPEGRLPARYGAQGPAEHGRALSVAPSGSEADARFAPMQRYFFEFNGEVDDDGVPLSDVTAARREAMRTLGEMLRDLEAAVIGHECVMRVLDEDGASVLSVRIYAKAELPV